MRVKEKVCFLSPPPVAGLLPSGKVTIKTLYHRGGLVESWAIEDRWGKPIEPPINKTSVDPDCPVHGQKEPTPPSKADPLEERVIKTPMFNDLICEKCESKIGPFPSKPYLCKKCKAKLKGKNERA